MSFQLCTQLPLENNIPTSPVANLKHIGKEWSASEEFAKVCLGLEDEQSTVVTEPPPISMLNCASFINRRSSLPVNSALVRRLRVRRSSVDDFNSMARQLGTENSDEAARISTEKTPADTEEESELRWNSPTDRSPTHTNKDLRNDSNSTKSTEELCKHHLSKSTETLSVSDSGFSSIRPKSTAPPASRFRIRRGSLPTGKPTTYPSRGLRDRIKSTQELCVDQSSNEKPFASNCEIVPTPPTAAYQRRRRGSLPVGKVITGGEASASHPSISNNLARKHLGNSKSTEELRKTHVSTERLSVSEDFSGTHTKSTSPSVLPFRNRRCSLPANTLSIRPRTSLGHVKNTLLSKSNVSVRDNDRKEEWSVSSTEPDNMSFTRLKRTSTLSENCRALANLMSARSEAIARLSKNTNTSKPIISPTEPSAVDNQNIPGNNLKMAPRRTSIEDLIKQTSPRPPQQPLLGPGERQSRATMQTARQKASSTNTSPVRGWGNVRENLGDLLSVEKSNRLTVRPPTKAGMDYGASRRNSSRSPARPAKPRDTLINTQRRHSIKQLDPNILLLATRKFGQSNGDHDAVTVTREDSSPVLSAAGDSIGSNDTNHPLDPTSWSLINRRTDEEIEEQVEEELKQRMANRRRQMKNMMTSGRRLNALQLLGPRSHATTKLLEHMPGNRLRKFMDEVDHNRTTNELIEVRVETLKVSLP